MFYSGSTSPPRSPALKKFKAIHKNSVEKKMGDDMLASTNMPGVCESSLMWLMLDQSNYTEWAMLM